MSQKIIREAAINLPARAAYDVVGCAGATATVVAKTGASPRQVSISAVQAERRRQGVVL